MCAIVDANVIGEIFGDDRPEAGSKFFDWLTIGFGVLIVGGELYEELCTNDKFRKWASEAAKSGRMKIEDSVEIDEREIEITESNLPRSNDTHVLALAQASGARLFYSNDLDLVKDFKDKSLIDGPRGKVYHTSQNKAFTLSHKRLLANRTLCRLQN